MTYFEVCGCFGLVRSCGSIPEIVELPSSLKTVVLCNSRYNAIVALF